MPTFQVVMPQGRFAESQQRQAVDEELLARIRMLPRVQAAGATNVRPLTPVTLRLRFAVPERPDITGAQVAVAEAALKAGRLAQGIEVKIGDGQTLPFGPPK